MDEEAPTPNSWTPLVALAWLIPFMFFAAGYGQMDRLEPNVGGAFGLYLGAFLFAAGAVAVAVVFRAGIPHWPLITGGILAFPAAFFIAIPAQDLYNDIGLGFYFVYLFAPVTLTLFAISMIGFAIARGKEGARDGLWMWGLALSGGMGGAALYHLATIQVQAELAREAHQSPMGALLAVVVLLAFAAGRQSK